MWSLATGTERNAHSLHILGYIKVNGRPVIVEDLCKDAWMPVEEVLVENGIVVGQSFRQPREPRCRDLLQRCLVRFVADATAVEHHPIFRVHRAEYGIRRRHHLQITRPALDGHQLYNSSFTTNWFDFVFSSSFFFFFKLVAILFVVFINTHSTQTQNHPQKKISPFIWIFLFTFGQLKFRIAFVL